MFDIVDTTFNYERELTVCSFLHDFSEGIGSSLWWICNADTTFLLGAEYWSGLHEGLSAKTYMTYYLQNVLSPSC